MTVWCINGLHCPAWHRLLSGRNRFCQFNVCCIVAFAAECNGIFTGFSQHMEFMGLVTTNRTGVSLYSTKLQSHTGKDAGITFVHDLVSFL